MWPALIAIAKVALVAIWFGAMATCLWANSRMIKRAREAGYPYWLINPMSAIAGLRGIETLIFVIAVHIGVAAVLGLIALK